jgi:hypothetical protein
MRVLNRSICFAFLFCSSVSQALELDWSGQFWTEYQFLHNYAMGSSTPTTSGGYAISGGGSKNASFETLFLRLNPRVLVNDNVSLRSEWWVGNPVFGLFGNAVPYTSDQNQFYSQQSRGASITAQRFWGEFVTDLGTFQVGRLPLQWGLGIVWNAGDQLWDRYVSTSDGIRFIAQFGSLTFIPSVLVRTTGSTVGGAYSSGSMKTVQGSAGLTDYSLIAKYESMAEQLELGINLLRRIGGNAQEDFKSPLGSRMVWTMYDLFLQKKFSRFQLAVEAPIVRGVLGSSNYSAFGLAGELSYEFSDSFLWNLKGGYASGQKSSTSATPSSFEAFSFNPNYRIAMILFNYQLANLSGVQTLNQPSEEASQLRSPYDNPIVNAVYVSLGTDAKIAEKWSLTPRLISAMAPQTATPGGYYYNSWPSGSEGNREIKSNQASARQKPYLGTEVDLGLVFRWDDSIAFHWDQGIFFPGAFYAFSASNKSNRLTAVYATAFRVGVQF